MVVGIGHFLRSAAVRCRYILSEPCKGHRIVAQGQRGAGARDYRPPERRPGSEFQPTSSPLPPNHLPFADSGGEDGRGGIS
jgi:hypothetical protein